MYYLDVRRNQAKSSDFELQRYAILLLTCLFGAPKQCTSTSQIDSDDGDRNDKSDSKVLTNVNVILFAEKRKKKLNKRGSTQSASAQPILKSQDHVLKNSNFLRKWGKV